MSRQKKRVALFVVTSLLVFSLSNLANAATIGFKPGVTYPVGTGPLAVVAGDFNGDGKIDLAVVNNGNASAGDDGGVSILLGNGDGTFRAAVNIPVGKNPVSIAVVDFNGDNRLDLAVIKADGGVGDVGILLGNGDGTFQSPVDYATGNGPNKVAVGDFNGDDKPDLVVANGTDNTVSILLGNGDGTFRSRVDYTTGGPPHGIAVAEFNGDGKADLAVPAGLRGVAVLLGNGDGTFQSATFYDSGAFGVVAAVLGDFNGDGKVDLFANFTQFHGGVIDSRGDLLVGNGDGTFQLVRGVVILGSSPNNGYVSQADFNGDGKLDLVTAQPAVSAVSNVSVWAGNGDGTFQTPITLTAGSSPHSGANVDLNGDKSPDIVVANTGDNTISVLLNTVGTDFSISTSVPNPATVSRGQSATSTVTLNLLNAFDNPVALTCSVQPAQAAPTCSLNPNSVTFDANGNATATLTINTGTATASFAAPSPSRESRPLGLLWLPVAGFAFMGAGFGSSLTLKRKLTVCLLGGILFSGLILQAACGSGRSGPRSQAYTITVTGTSGSAQHSTTTTLTVQ